MVVVLDLESKSGDDPTDFSARAGVSIVDLGLLKKGVVKFRLKRKSLFFAHVREGANDRCNELSRNVPDTPSSVKLRGSEEGVREVPARDESDQRSGSGLVITHFRFPPRSV